MRGQELFNERARSYVMRGPCISRQVVMVSKEVRC